jgi:iron(III) transport system substrate-binding protein
MGRRYGISLSFIVPLLVASACAPAASPSPAATAPKPAAEKAAPPAPTQAAPVAAKAAPTVPASKPAPGAAAQPSPKAAEKAPVASGELAKLREGAQQEGEVIYMGRTPLRESMAKMVPAFNQRFGLNIKLNQVAIDAREVPTRLVAEANQPTASGDVAWGLLSGALILQEAGSLQKYAWVETFGSELPAIKDRVERIMEPARGGALEAQHSAYGLIFNTTQVKREELPKTWDELGDPKWAGRFGVDPGGNAFAYLLNALGEEKVLEIARRVKANRPVFTQAASDTAQRVVAGQIAFGIAPTDQGEAQKRLGAPTDWMLMDPIALTQTVYYLPKNPPHPNAARLFGAWLTTEGLKMLEELEGRGLSWPGSGFRTAQAVEDSKFAISLAKSVQELEQEEEVRKKVAAILTQ